MGGVYLIKKLDIVILIFLLVISFIPHLIFGYALGYDYDRTYAEITIGGKFYKKIPLSEHSGEDTIEIKAGKHINKIKVVDNKLSIVEADCPDSLCIHQGEISKVGQSVVCLPNKLMVEIKGNKIEDNDEDIILSH